MSDTDEDGYPTEEALERIRKWPDTDLPGLLDYCRSLWYYPDYWGPRKDAPDLLDISTGGWSGNESVIEAMMDHWIWFVAWESSRRGGHYTLDLIRVRRLPEGREER